MIVKSATDKILEYRECTLTEESIDEVRLRIAFNAGFVYVKKDGKIAFDYQIDTNSAIPGGFSKKDETRREELYNMIKSGEPFRFFTPTQIHDKNVVIYIPSCNDYIMLDDNLYLLEDIGGDHAEFENIKLVPLSGKFEDPESNTEYISYIIGGDDNDPMYLPYHIARDIQGQALLLRIGSNYSLYDKNTKHRCSLMGTFRLDSTDIKYITENLYYISIRDNSVNHWTSKIIDASENFNKTLVSNTGYGDNSIGFLIYKSKVSVTVGINKPVIYIFAYNNNISSTKLQSCYIYYSGKLYKKFKENDLVYRPSDGGDRDYYIRLSDNMNIHCRERSTGNVTTAIEDNKDVKINDVTLREVMNQLQ